MRNKFIYLIILSPLFLFCANTVHAATYYAAPTGSGSTCASSTPCSLTSGINKLASGDTLLLDGGTYNVSSLNISKSGVTVKGNGNGETILYGGYTNYGTRVTYSALVNLSGSNSIIRDITVANSPGEGIEMTGASSQLINVFVHHSGENGIILKGDYSVCDGCRAWSNAMSNQGGTQSIGWGTGISACRSPEHATIKNSVAWENWGEGLSTFESTFTTIENSVSYNNWSVNMYLSDTTNTIAQGNLIYRTANNLGGMQVGLALGDEVSNPSSANNTVINNLVMGGNHALWVWDNKQQNTVISNNTFVNASSESTVEISGGTNGVFKNNIIVQDDSRSISGGISGFAMANNVWSKSPSSKGSTDVVGNPQLARTGTIGAGTLTGDWFKLTSASTLAIDKATPLSSVTVDYFKNGRPIGAAPDIGAHEYSSGTVPTPTATPSTKIGDINNDGIVNTVDIGIVVDNYGKLPVTNSKADINSDGSVNILDIGIIIDNYGK
jgi:hypothetical protein